MNINVMRKADYWLGIPLCFLITMLYKLGKAFRPGKPECRPDRVLFVKLFGLGSIVLSYPALKLVKDSFPSARLSFLTFEQNREALTLLGLIGEEGIITVKTDSLRHLVTGLWSVMRRIRRERFDIVVDLEFFSRFTAILGWLSGARCRVGYYNYHVEGLYRGNCLTHKVYYNCYKHAAESYMYLVSIMGIKEHPAPALPLIRPDDDEKERTLRLLAEENPRVGGETRLVVFNVNSSNLAPELRKWDAERFAALGDRIAEKHDDVAVVFIGGESDGDYVRSVIGKMGRADRAVNLAGKTNMRDLLALFAMARAFVSCDSGPMHLAALTGVPVLAIFGPETPRIYAPLSKNSRVFYKGDFLNCSPCMTVYNGKWSQCSRSRKNYKECMRLISVDEVYGEVAGYLQ